MSWYRTLSIRAKLQLAFALLAVINAIVGVGALWTMRLLDTRLETAYREDLPAVSAIKEAGIYQLKAMRVLLRVVLAAGDTDEINNQNAELKVLLEKERTQIALCKSKVHSKEGNAELESATKLLPQFNKGAADIVTAAKAGDVIGFRDTIKDLVPLSDKIQHSFDQVSLITERQAARSKTLASASYWSALTAMIPMVIGAGVLAAVMSFVMSSAIASPLRRMVKFLEAVAKGDLRHSLGEKSKDEVGQLAASLNQALASIRATLHQVSRSAEGLKSASGALAQTASSLAESSASQAEGLQAVTANLEAAAVTARETATHSARANELGTTARNAAEDGNRTVKRAVTAMEDIERSSKEISTLATVIDQIAFQSHVLAINAAIEAAHAGETGRSFAVVATEISRLAERSRGSAEEIESLIGKSIDHVAKGSKLVNRSGEALTEITGSVKSLSSIVNEMSNASLGAERLSEAMRKVDSLVQANCSNTQDLSTTAQELADLAGDLNATLTQFTLGDGAENDRNVYDDWGDAFNAVRMKFFGFLGGARRRFRPA